MQSNETGSTVNLLIAVYCYDRVLRQGCTATLVVMSWQSMAVVSGNVLSNIFSGKFSDKVGDS